MRSICLEGLVEQHFFDDAFGLMSAFPKVESLPDGESHSHKMRTKEGHRNAHGLTGRYGSDLRQVKDYIKQLTIDVHWATVITGTCRPLAPTLLGRVKAYGRDNIVSHSVACYASAESSSKSPGGTSTRISFFFMSMA